MLSAINSQTFKIVIEECDINKEAAVCLLRAVGDRQLSLEIA